MTRKEKAVIPRAMVTSTKLKPCREPKGLRRCSAGYLKAKALNGSKAADQKEECMAIVKRRMDSVNPYMCIVNK